MGKENTVSSLSVIVPVLNEEKSIDALLTGLTKQTLPPNEVIIVDGGSADQTWQILKKWQGDKLAFDLVLIEKKNANRSVSRNLGIKRASSDVVALTDAGCVPKPDWLELLTEPFVTDRNTQVVAGFYDPAPKSWWEDVLAQYTSVRDWNFHESIFLPSSRSIAFTKQIWEAVGKYPEELDTCEDLVFATHLKENATGWRVVKEAQVIWQQPKTLSELSHKIYQYALGDLEARYERHVRKIHSALWRAIVLLGFAVPSALVGQSVLRMVGVVLLVMYLLGSIGKQVRMLKYPWVVVVLPLLQLTVDSALIQAFIYHTLSSKYK